MESTPTKEYLWLVNHPEVEAQYPGEWIAVHGDHIVAHGRDLEEVLKKISSLKPSPHITYIEEAGLAAYALYLFL